MCRQDQQEWTDIHACAAVSKFAKLMQQPRLEWRDGGAEGVRQGGREGVGEGVKEGVREQAPHASPAATVQPHSLHTPALAQSASPPPLFGSSGSSGLPSCSGSSGLPQLHAGLQAGSGQANLSRPPPPPPPTPTSPPAARLPYSPPPHTTPLAARPPTSPLAAFNELLASLAGRVPRLGARAVSNVLWAVAKVLVMTQPEAQHAAVAGSGAAVAGTGAGGGEGASVRALQLPSPVPLCLHPEALPSLAMVTHLLPRVHQLAPDMEPQHVSSVLYACMQARGGRGGVSTYPPSSTCLMVHVCGGGVRGAALHISAVLFACLWVRV